MKKSSLITLLCLVLLLCAFTLVLTACGKCKHVGGTATCTCEAICTKCNQPYGEISSSNHSGSLEWMQKETTHKQYYNCCQEVTVEETAHTWQEGRCSACDKPVTEGLSYSLFTVGTDTFASVTAYYGTDTEVVIASTYQGFPVITIDVSAFNSCSKVTDIVIPGSVKTIERYAFANCIGLKSLVIPNSVTFIGERAFSHSDGITKVVIPTSVKTIGRYAFEYCDSLTIYCEATSQLSDWDSTWNDSNCPVVWNCNNNQVATDGKVYANIEGLRYALKDGKATVSRLRYNATTVTIPSTVVYQGTKYNVTAIGEAAFYYCTNLTSVTMGNSVTTIGASAFDGCGRLSSLVISDSVISIGGGAFCGCGSLTSVVIPDSVISIGDGAFHDCTSLKSIVIPASVTAIGLEAFYNCPVLTIYCKATSQPSGWNSGWNYLNRPVYWSGQWQYDENCNPTPNN